METNQIKIVIKKPHNESETICVNNNLKTFQKLVGGYIECISFPNDRRIQFVANEEAKIFGLLPNLCLPHYRDILCGNIAVVGTDEDDEFIGLTDRQIKKVNHYIETFRIDNILYGDRDVLREQMLKKMQKYDQEEDLC